MIDLSLLLLLGLGFFAALVFVRVCERLTGREPNSGDAP